MILVAAAAAAEPPPRVLPITQAERAPLAAWSANVASARAVSLPDAWRTRGLGQMAMAAYRIELPLPEGVPARMQALRFTHISARVLMYLNGRLLYERGAALADAHAIRTLPLLVEVPPALLGPSATCLSCGFSTGIGNALAWPG